MMIHFSICLPVRNGWPYVRECVQSVLNQTYPHFELIVLDNQSTDETVQWLTSLNDPRIRILRSSEPLSIVDSWTRIKSVEKQEFMTLIGHDDVLGHEYLAAIKGLIERHPEAGLYFTGGRLINSDGKTIRSCKPVPEYETAANYLKARFTFQRDVFGTGYVMRSSDYDRLGGIPGFEKLFFADDTLWISLMSGSYKASDPAEHFAVRIHPNSESASLPSVWPSLLLGLNQFNEFLQGHIKEDPSSKDTTNAHGANFMLSYHRNAYIFGLVEASQAGHKISRDNFERIASSLKRIVPGRENDLRRSAKVKILEALNASPARILIPPLWNLYCQLKNKS